MCYFEDWCHLKGSIQAHSHKNKIEVYVWSSDIFKKNIFLKKKLDNIFFYFLSYLKVPQIFFVFNLNPVKWKFGWKNYISPIFFVI